MATDWPAGATTTKLKRPLTARAALVGTGDWMIIAIRRLTYIGIFRDPLGLWLDLVRFGDHRVEVRVIRIAVREGIYCGVREMPDSQPSPIGWERAGVRASVSSNSRSSL